MHKKNIVRTGKPIESNAKVMIMIHGRGANAQDILGLAPHLHLDNYVLIAPEATNNTWYPFSFLSPTTQNEPWLTSALDILQDLVKELNDNNIPSSNIYFCGFSQGACLTLEFVARNAQKFGGVIAFTGGLIGDRLNRKKYMGDFENTPVFIGSSNPDPHVPVERVYDTEIILNEMNAKTLVKIYDGMGHTITKEEIDTAMKWVWGIEKLAN